MENRQVYARVETENFFINGFDGTIMEKGYTRRSSMDHFREESVSRYRAGISSFLYIVGWMLMILFGIIAIFGASGLMSMRNILYNAILLAGGGGLAYGAYVFKNNQRIEYDYTFTNGTFDIAKVINNNKRKRVLSLNVRELDQVAHTSDPGFQKALANPAVKKKYNCFLNRGGGLYYAIMIHDGQKSLLVFEPSKEMLKLFKTYNPHNVHI